MDARVSTTHPIGVGKEKINPMSIQIRVIRVSHYEPIQFLQAPNSESIEITSHLKKS